ncbi:Hypothetical predicted protein [Mytilus galloprovincialis]|uniref:Integrase zinc-binding domain-containing protein n=1 Tax=Mytilus galloprovincialis TaxID=29158 RepID=A0A8B6GC36_MYTGA|nr:Hypothetical predicted protein [Mytilus galloprovincialis]
MSPRGQLARWLEELSQYDLVIKHRPGKQHIDADVLSRLPDRLKECPHYTADTILASLPCKGCNYCQRAHQSWAQFLCDVDEAVPLARKRKQKPRLLKRVATAMMMLFETPEKVSTLKTTCSNQLNLQLWTDCCHTSSLNSIEPIASQSSEECDLPPFSTGMELIFTPSTARIVMDDSSDCVVAAIAQEEGITYLRCCEPLSNDLFLAPPAAKSHWINKERFFLDDNGILKSQPKTEGANTRLVVPASLRQTVMELCHELPSAGHQGVSRTMSKIKDKYHWYNMTKDINLFVLSCDTCNKNKKASRHSKCPLTKYHAGYPMERVHIDFMGPLPKTETKQ